MKLIEAPLYLPYEAAIGVANRTSKRRRMYFTAIPVGTNGKSWLVTNKFDPRVKV